MKRNLLILDQFYFYQHINLIKDQIDMILLKKKEFLHGVIEFY